MLQKGKGQICYVALGSRDRSLSIWSTALKRPLVVIRDAFTNSVMDLTWSSDAKMMMACSGDGTVAIATFSKEEIGDPLNQEEMVSLGYGGVQHLVDVVLHDLGWFSFSDLSSSASLWKEIKLSLQLLRSFGPKCGSLYGKEASRD